MPAKIPNPAVPHPDSSLWIIHYTRADQSHQLPANVIPVVEPVRKVMTERRFLQQHGQLLRKEFMLHDRPKWPNIQLPSGGMPQAWNPNSNYPNNVMSQMRGTHPSYSMQQPAMHQGPMGPAAKRQRQVGPSHAHGTGRGPMPVVPQESSLEDEDPANGDDMDTLAPREISSTRYIKHHEWMEEIFSSPYNTSQIVPVELGLGRKGEIESLTKEFFNASVDRDQPVVKGAAPARVGKMENGQAEDFVTKATDRIAQLNAEMEKLKRQHARRTAKFSRTNAIKEAERALRDQASSKRENDSTPGKTDRFDEAVEKVQNMLGKSIKLMKEVECMERGGLEEKSRALDRDPQDFDLDQAMQDLGPQDSHSTPYNIQQAPSSRDFNSAGQTPQRYPSMPMGGDGAQDDEPVKGTATEDVTMEEMPSEANPKDGDTGDWVIVDKGDSKPEEDNPAPEGEAIPTESGLGGDFGAPGEMLNTTENALEDFAAEQGTTGEFNPDDFNDTVDFGSLAGTGEALSGFSEGTNAEISLEEPGDLGLDDSAFGEAFHVPEPSDLPETGGAEPGQ